MNQPGKLPIKLAFPALLLAVLLGCQSEALLSSGTGVTRTAAPPLASPTEALLPTATTLAPTATASVAEPSHPGSADADVVYVRAVLAADSNWTFHVTVSHPDTGWEDYVDGWDVVLPDGEVVKPDVDSPFTRLLLHPHENEQPFTRSQSGIVIPEAVLEVEVRAHDLVHGFGGRTVTVDLLVTAGPDFVVER